MDGTKEDITNEEIKQDMPCGETPPEQPDKAKTEAAGSEAVEEAAAEADAKTAEEPVDFTAEKSKKDKSGKLKKELERTEKALQKAEKERAEYLDALMRERADFENYKKRNAVSVSRAFADGKADAILALLPVADNLDRAADTECSDAAYKSGVELVKKQLTDTFIKMGAEEIEALGKPFDPNLHNAVMQVPAEDGEESGIVKTVLMKGYRTGDKVIRHAMVQVTE